MPSKQKKKKKSGRGKAKKVAVGSSKHTKKEKQQAAIDIDAQMEQSIDVQKKQLMISGSDNSQPYDEASLLEEAIKLATAEKEALEYGTGGKEESSKPKRKRIYHWECHHGYVIGEDHLIINDFCKTFWSEFITTPNCGVKQSIIDAFGATYDKYPEIWSDEPKLKLARSMYFMYGTQNIIEGDLADARLFAFLACHMKGYIDIHKDSRKVKFDLVKEAELLQSDEHTLVQYLRHHIPCTCLDKKYEEVKSITKLGLCWNTKCSLPNRMMKRSKMLCCDRCRTANYCSHECQKANWQEHKGYCDKYLVMQNDLIT